MKCRLNIKVPDEEVAFPLLGTDNKMLDSDRLIDTDNDPGRVKDEEHDDGDNENDGEVTVLLTLIESALCKLRSYKNLMRNFKEEKFDATTFQLLLCGQ